MGDGLSDSDARWQDPREDRQRNQKSLEQDMRARSDEGNQDANPVDHSKMEAEIAIRFTYHRPDASKVRNGKNQIERYTYLRDQAYQMALGILYHTPPGREQSLAFTKLEEAIMHANSAIARRE